jgi:uncharacterized Tic20 family protein
MTQTPPPPTWVYTPPPPLSPEDQRLWATLVHVGGIFFGALPALIGYLVTRDRGEFIHQHTRAALNFQLTLLIGVVAGSVLSIILIGFVVLFAVEVLAIVFGILAAIAAHNGQPYRFPISIQFVK